MIHEGIMLSSHPETEKTVFGPDYEIEVMGRYYESVQKMRKDSKLMRFASFLAMHTPRVSKDWALLDNHNGSWRLGEIYHGVRREL